MKIGEKGHCWWSVLPASPTPYYTPCLTCAYVHTPSYDIVLGLLLKDLFRIEFLRDGFGDERFFHVILAELKSSASLRCSQDDLGMYIYFLYMCQSIVFNLLACTNVQCSGDILLFNS